MGSVDFVADGVRANRADRRREVEVLVERASYLDPPDRALLEATFDRGIETVLLAHLAGKHRRSVRARVQRLLERVASPLYVHVIDHRASWSARRRAIADRAILRHTPQRAIARELNLTLHQVRSELAAIRAEFEFTRASTRPSRRSHLARSCSE